MSRTREQMKGRRDSGSFVMLPHAVIDSPNWLKLSHFAVKLFVDIYGQFRGNNNGDLCAAWSVMHKRGWRSKATLAKTLKELEWYGFIIRARQGGRKRATLYAVTFKDIDECKRKLDIKAGPPPGNWRQCVGPFASRLPTKKLSVDSPALSLPHPLNNSDTAGGVNDGVQRVH